MIASSDTSPGLILPSSPITTILPALLPPKSVVPPVVGIAAIALSTYDLVATSALLAFAARASVIAF